MAAIRRRASGLRSADDDGAAPMAVDDVRATFLSKHPEVIETMDRMLLGTVRMRVSRRRRPPGGCAA